jgi:hypothetical protein
VPVRGLRIGERIWNPRFQGKLLMDGEDFGKKNMPSDSRMSDLWEAQDCVVVIFREFCIQISRHCVLCTHILQ